MADRSVTGEALPSEDVEMEDADSHPGNGPDSKSNETTNSSEQTGSAHIKSDPEKQQSSPSADSTKMKPAPKKKGTAAKKGPRKARTTKSKASSKKDTSTSGPTTDAREGSSDDETDNGPYCICRGPDDHRWMIGCDVCEDWFHGECVNLDKETGEKLVERFVCPNCTDGKKNYTKYKKTCSLSGCKNAARLYTKTLKDRSVFCCNDHCDAWWVSIINTLPTKAASAKAVEVLTQEDFVGLLASTSEKIGWKLGDQPFGMFLLTLVLPQ